MSSLGERPGWGTARPSVSKLIEGRLRIMEAFVLPNAKPLGSAVLVDALQELGLQKAYAEALMSDAVMAIPYPLVEGTAEMLGLHPSLLACLACPTSEEIAWSTLVDLRNDLQVHTDLGAAWEKLSPQLERFLAEGGEWRGLCLQLLNNYWPASWFKLLGGFAAEFHGSDR